MGKRENKVETYLNDEIEKCGGITRKWTSPGHVGVPDRIVMIDGNVFFVETKSSDGKLSSQQEREHKRLRENGITVFTFYNPIQIDIFIKSIGYE